MAEVDEPRAVHEVDLTAGHMSSLYDSSAEFPAFVPETSAEDVLETLVSDIIYKASLRKELHVTSIYIKKYDAVHEEINADTDDTDR